MKPWVVIHRPFTWLLSHVLYFVTGSGTRVEKKKLSAAQTFPDEAVALDAEHDGLDVPRLSPSPIKP